MSESTPTIPGLIKKYPVFEPNQVLTSRIMNELRDYLDGQNDMSRSHLIGQGILFGFEIRTNAAKETIHLRPGIGITSSGLMVNITEKIGPLKRYRSFGDDETGYGPFFKGENIIDLWELLPDDAEWQDERTLDSIFLANKVLIIYLDEKLHDLRSCLTVDCNDRGQELRFHLRLLLANRDDLKLRNDKLPVVFPQEDPLPPMFAPHVRVVPADIPKLAQIYESACGDKFLEVLETALIAAHNTYAKILPGDMRGENPFAYAGDNFKLKKNGLIPSHLQYFYAYIRDFCKAYMEFRDAAMDVCRQGPVFNGSFSRHLLAGEVTGNHVYPLRHHFQAATTNRNPTELKQLKFLYQKLVKMLDAFKIPKKGKASERIRITPDRELGEPLSERSIPYYLLPSRGPKPKLHDIWNPKKALKGRAKEVYSWWAKEYSDLPHVLDPLRYRTDGFPFFRIEGHIGLPLNDVLDQLDTLKKTYRLPIQILNRSVSSDNDSRGNNNDTVTVSSGPGLSSEFGYHDLQEEYIIFRNQIMGFLENLGNFAELQLEEYDGPYPYDYQELDEIYTRLRIKTRVHDGETVYGLDHYLKPHIDEFADGFEGFCRTYKLAIQETIDYIIEVSDDPGGLIKHLFRDLATIRMNNRQRWINGIFKTIYNIIDALFFRKFFRLYYGYLRRKAYLDLLSNDTPDQGISVSTQNTPGELTLEHQGGAPAGGSFVLLHELSDDNVPIVSGDLTVLLETGAQGTTIITGGSLPVPIHDPPGFNAQLKIKPFARPDYAIGQYVDPSAQNPDPLIIDVISNDYLRFSSGVEITQATVESGVDEQGNSVNPGTVNFTADNKLQYYIRPGFVGICRIRYEIRDIDHHDLKDDALVTVFIHPYPYKIELSTDEVIETAEPDKPIARILITGGDGRAQHSHSVWVKEPISLDVSGEELILKRSIQNEGLDALSFRITTQIKVGNQFITNIKKWFTLKVVEEPE